jgi:uncharacterized protein YrrD
MTDALMRGHDLIGHPVVALSTGDDLAEIKDIIFDAGRGQITGFTLRKRSFFGGTLKAVLPLDGVASVGTDAVMIESEESLAAPDNEHAESLARGDDVLDNMVITESGRTLGSVQDVIVVGGTSPRVVGFEIGGGTVGSGLIPLAAKQGVSWSALIVPDEFEQRVRTDLTGLAAELTDIEASRS